eukprot:767579-Hanusia_phi.AAC.14
MYGESLVLLFSPPAQMKPSRTPSFGSNSSFSRSSSAVDPRPASDLHHHSLFPRPKPAAPHPAPAEERSSWRESVMLAAYDEGGGGAGYEPVSPKSVLAGHSTALRLTPKAPLPPPQLETSPKSIRSQRSSTRLLDEAFDEVLADARFASQGQPLAKQPELQQRGHGQADEWIRLLNPLAALDFDDGSSSWERELNNMMQSMSSRDNPTLPTLPTPPGDRVRQEASPGPQAGAAADLRSLQDFRAVPGESAPPGGEQQDARGCQGLRIAREDEAGCEERGRQTRRPDVECEARLAQVPHVSYEESVLSAPAQRRDLDI